MRGDGIRCDMCGLTEIDQTVRFANAPWLPEGWWMVDDSIETNRPLDFCSLACLRRWAGR